MTSASPSDVPSPHLLARLPAATGSPLRILYFGDLSENSTALHRCQAMRRLGHDVTTLDLAPIAFGGPRWWAALTHRTLIGPSIAAANRAVLEAADPQSFDIAWFDKAIAVRRETVVEVGRRGLTTVHFTSDLPFVDRGDVGRRLLMAAAGAYHHCVVPSPGHVPFYRAAGCRSVLRMPFGFDPFSHFPPPPGWRPPEAERAAVRFIGSPYGDRAATLVRLARDHGIPVAINGNRWSRMLSRAERALLKPMTERVGAAYREAIWASDICLGFVTHEMRHDEARRWPEIAACGGFLLAEGADDPDAFFRPGRDAEVFTDAADAAATIRRYLGDPDGRRRIAASGRDRVWPARSNDVLVDGLLRRIGGAALDPDPGQQ